ncbi:4-hydroxyphenylpyruvate dioxygenase [Halobacteriovorax marinus]|uniref:4-hydroxyphenylpyruvate dioxygenase n=1 Tax=Halobacteriovorax marinus TaxID=97084 RepID=UPI000BDF48BB|nr:4-hydroxyphenylpyruvate dioxygenase [Halobacteriovorax marinus]
MSNNNHSKINDKNPLGILAIDHLEFTCGTIETPTKDLFYKFGFSKTYENEELNAQLFSQGQVRFLLISDNNPTSHSTQYFKDHGEGVSKISFLVEDCAHAIKTAVARGAEMISDAQTIECDEGVFITATIKGFGDVVNEFIQRPNSHFRPGFKKIENDPKANPLAHRVARIDHLTNNVPKGEMEKWVQFYKDIYGMVETRYFDIKGAKTGLNSKVVQLENNAVIIPINEPEVENGKSQIQEFLDLHKGSGVQHIALTCGKILSTVPELIKRDISFLDIPSSYYEMIPERGIKVEEDLKDLEDAKLLVDGDADGYLIQNFTQTYVGPLFFEFIQRKNNEGFGEGNFQALFDAIERDQVARGYLD